MGLDVRTPVITKNAGRSTQSYSLCLAFSNAFGVFLLPFMGKFIQLIKSATHFLHALGQAVSHGRGDRRLVVAVLKNTFFPIAQALLLHEPLEFHPVKPAR